ncbi:type II secretion system secretin GspD [Limnohabitans sp.]|uniref:type II secretion system secretin GspD n=1 Tax=Limnohabitans sp. TaxID=1907725 RepID=UPI00386213BD
MAKQRNFFQPSVLALALSLSFAPVMLGLSLSHAAPPAKKAASSEPITLNFVNAEIESVARTLATLSNRNLVVDPRVKGTINLTTELPVSANEAWSQFLAALRLQGFAMVETKGLYKIVPEADAKLQGGNVQEIQSGQGGSGSGQIVTHIFKLNFEQANNLLPVLRPLISPNNTINVNPGNNSIIITDYADNLQRMARIIATLDVSNASDVEVIQLKHAIAVDLAPLVLRLVESGNANNAGAAAATPGQTGTEYKTTLLAEPRSNSLIVRAANPARVALVKSLVAKLDQPSGASASGNIHVVYLKNADATKLATTLRAAVSGQATANAGSAMATGAGVSPMATNPSSPMTTGSTLGSTTASAGSATGGQIQADTATNSLIITAPEPQYRQLRAVIDMLDQRRAQVMVESLIAEVNADKAAEMGIQWQTANGQKGGTVGIIGTNFNNPITTTVGQGNILSVSGGAATALSALGGGLNIGSAKQINGTYVLSSLATFLQQNGDGNVLSTPTLLTLDNEEAKIVVGQNVPFVTGQYTNNNTSNGSVNPFQTVERKDVGLTLKVKPQISETGTVKLTIFQEVSSIDYTRSSTAGLITNKRSIESNVLVDDGSIIVLGGLLSDEYSGGASQVPLFGDIPVLGWLFKSESRSRTKKNLMVFLRPVVVRDAAASDALSNNRYQQMMGLQQSSQPGFNPIIGAGSAPVLPPLPATAPGSASTPAK